MVGTGQAAAKEAWLVAVKDWERMTIDVSTRWRVAAKDGR